METIVNGFNQPNAQASPLAYGLTMVAAGLAIMGAGVVSVGQGMAVAKAVEAIGRNPEATSKIRSTLIMGLAIVETASIYCFIIALLIIFV
ncbi:ATP synthase C chain [Metamycoplasma arthritidis]|uniref:ATP synthase subunit c n=1 Tax=Metamycoplasma arthritidis (strain 158L3-1) TaxID=243272 RepID=ATPL_META1|nr:ATP synthase F0 subunit C [Metamycoplasma arthritidis]B3PLV3.1 RecName: Full=ATP synthase subunit c; AltName: Full=ATP synthase F(0) sector subunit c; AltName: Full=F-type ATPase subunit c; Short=F-ATPase subunit c; AltName: Full=Lipid-binding protein [Metamycoplasma arthritidis 158L3-1]ACF07005.1 ATP synthase C chain [Metamycoplasma arthritidis 158L3-1]VEU78533.1 ATP synthase C chain [Metamycoplasma arthritidis]